MESLGFDIVMNNHKEPIEDKYGNIYNKNLFNKVIITEDEESQKILNLANEIYLNEIFFRKKIKIKQYSDEIYLISYEWYNKFKEYSHYKKIKRVIRNIDIYSLKKQIVFKLDSNKFPGQINNESLIIKDDNNNLLLPNNYLIKSDKKEKKDFKIFPKESFILLNKEFGCDYILKSELKLDRQININKYNIYSKKFTITFIPIKEYLIEKHEINTYEIYIPLLLTIDEIYEYISNILNSNKYKSLKTNLGLSMINKKILTSYIKIYHLHKDSNLNKFKNFINNNIENLSNNERILGSDYLQKIEKEYQINQLQYNNLIIEFSYFKNGELFNNISNDLEIYNTNKETIPKIKKISSINDDDDLKFYISEKKEEKKPKKKKKISPPSNFYSFRRQEYQEEDILDKNDNNHGLVGLSNIGNTCYMNTSLQCLSNCNILTDYFLKDIYKQFINENNPIGSQGKLVESYAELIKNLWYGKKSYYSPNHFKSTIGNIRTIFRGYQQQDTQEFLSFLLDGLHEDLNKVLNKPYICPNDDLKFENDIEKYKYYKNIFLARNQSLIVDLFYGMFKSTLFCPNQLCKNISYTFDPYAIISLPLTYKVKKRKIDVFFIYENLTFYTIKFQIKINNNTTVKYFRKKISYILKCGVYNFEIYLFDGNDIFYLVDDKKYNKISEFIGNNDSLFLYQIPNIAFKNKNKEIEQSYKEIIDENNIIYDRIKEFDKNEGKVDFEFNEETFDKEKYIRCSFYNYSYDYYQNRELINHYDYPPKDKFSFPRFFYIDIEWNNLQIFDYFVNYYRPVYDINEIDDYFKENNFKNYEENSIKLNNIEDSEDEENKKSNLTYGIQKSLSYPFIIIYMKSEKIIYNDTKITNSNDNENEENEEKNPILEISESKYIIKEEISEIKLNKNELITDYQLNFKLSWLPYYKKKLEDDIISSTSLVKRHYYHMSNKNEKEINLLDLLENFSQLEQLTEENKWYCPKCKEHQLAEKKIEIFTCPEILILHLKRFKNNSKLGNLINFPIEGLDMGKYLIYNENTNNDNIYDLFAVANHFGGLHFGHYIAYCKNKIENKWFEFNDSNVSEIDESKIVSSSAYVLFYKKRNSCYQNIDELYQKVFEKIDFDENE